MAPTPGPWTVDDRHDPIDGVVGADGFSVCEVGEMCISPAWQTANPRRHWGNGQPGSHIVRPAEEVEANARLIAAAPDMYLELQEIAGLSDEAINEGDPALLATYRDMARLLVAKVGLL